MTADRDRVGVFVLKWLLRFLSALGVVLTRSAILFLVLLGQAPPRPSEFPNKAHQLRQTLKWPLSERLVVSVRIELALVSESFQLTEVA